MGKWISFSCKKKYFNLFMINILVTSFLNFFLNEIGIKQDKKLSENYNPFLYLLLNYLGQSLFIIAEIIMNKCIFKSKKQIVNHSELSIEYI
jgi:hypothetical protein